VFPAHEDFEIRNEGRGWNGYQECHGVFLNEKRLGFIATGGDNQRGWSQVNLTGEAIPHIDKASESLTDCVERGKGQFKRVDIALTVMDGSITAQKVLEAHRSGGFDCSNNRPSCESIVPEEPTDGMTVYVGKRTQAKFVRAYDKGYQLGKQWGLDLVNRVDDFLPGGGRLADIFRVELELKLKPEEFPTDILLNTDSYFAGAYPYLATLVESDPSTFCLTPQRMAQLDVDQALAHIRKQWGPTLFTALMVHEGNLTAVWDKIVGSKHSKSLLERGVLFANA